LDFSWSSVIDLFDCGAQFGDCGLSFFLVIQGSGHIVDIHNHAVVSSSVDFYGLIPYQGFRCSFGAWAA
jgi:hypothetical protein